MTIKKRFSPSRCNSSLLLSLRSLCARDPDLMNDAAAPTREEVRSHKVTGSLRVLKSGKETPVVTNEASKARRNEKAHASGSGDYAALTQLDDGKIRLDYLAEKHTSYRRSAEEQRTDPPLFGYTESVGG